MLQAGHPGRNDVTVRGHEKPTAPAGLAEGLGGVEVVARQQPALSVDVVTPGDPHAAQRACGLGTDIRPGYGSDAATGALRTGLVHLSLPPSQLTEVITSRPAGARPVGRRSEMSQPSLGRWRRRHVVAAVLKQPEGVGAAGRPAGSPNAGLSADKGSGAVALEEVVVVPLAPIVFAAVVMEAAAIVAWPLHQPVAALLLLGAYMAQQVILVFQSAREPRFTSWRSR